MLQGICVNQGQSAVLEKGKSYFLFPNGPGHYYVSNFPNRDSHKGCFQTKFFLLIEKEVWPHEPDVLPVSLDPEKVYKARLIWRRAGYKMTELKDYYIKPNDTHATFYHDSSLNKPGGCFPLHWFSGFEEVIPVVIDQETPDFDIDFDSNDQILIETESKITEYEQLSFFDF